MHGRILFTFFYNLHVLNTLKVYECSPIGDDSFGNLPDVVQSNHGSRGNQFDDYYDDNFREFFSNRPTGG